MRVRRPQSRRRRGGLTRRRAAVAILFLALLLNGLAGIASAELSIIPGKPVVHPTPHSTPQVVGSVSGCQETIRLASSDLASAVRGAFSSCLARSLPCIFDAAGAAGCCAAATPECARQADAIGRAESDFVAQVVAPDCTSVPFDELAAENGLDFTRTTEACLRLDPPVDVDGLGSLATCLERLVTQDVLHLVASTEQPRAVEALVCMDLEDRFPGVLRERPATCDELATPTPVPTPTTQPGATPSPGPSGSPGASPTPGAPTPTPGAPTPTPGGGGCATTTVKVALSFSQTDFPDVSGVAVMLGYPASVAVPGIGSDPSVLARVTNLTGVSGGLFNVGDQDSNSDGVDDLLNVGLVSLGSAIPPGDFASVRFDCTAGSSAPAASAFTCAVDASTLAGNPVPAQCALTVTTP